MVKWCGRYSCTIGRFYQQDGFKIRGTGGDINVSGNIHFIYMAFAENPFVTSTGVPATAR